MVSKPTGAGHTVFDGLARVSRELQDAGHSLAATELDEGVRCVNGLTDGWALLLEAVEKVLTEHVNALTAKQRGALDEIRVKVRSIVYR